MIVASSPIQPSGPSSSSSPVFYSPYAAVPSLHVRFAFAIGIAAALARTRWSKALALSWRPIVTLSVVATGNHYVFDVAAGLAVTAVGFVAGRLALRLPRPTPAPERAIA